MNNTVKYDFNKLNKLVKNLSASYVVKVGIMGNKNSRSDKGDAKTMTNAEIGSIHEFGDPANRIPPRSFLRMPLSKKQDKIIKETSVGMMALLEKGDVLSVLKRLGVACEGAVLDAFNTGGFGLWKALTQFTVHKKGSDAILIDTGQLRRSISSKVEKLG